METKAIRLDQELPNVFKSYSSDAKLNSVVSGEYNKLINNIIIPPEILILNGDYKNIDITFTLPTQAKNSIVVLNSFVEVLNAFNNKNTLTFKSKKLGTDTITVLGLPVLVKDLEAQFLIQGNLNDISILEQDRQVITYSANLDLKLVDFR